MNRSSRAESGAWLTNKEALDKTLDRYYPSPVGDLRSGIAQRWTTQRPPGCQCRAEGLSGDMQTAVT